MVPVKVASVSALRDCKLSFVSRAVSKSVAAKNPEIYNTYSNDPPRRRVA